MKLLATQRQLGLAVCILITSVCFSYAHAGMFGTEQVAAKDQSELNKQAIRTALLREDVKQALLAHGVKPEHVQLRIDQLTDQEIQELSTRLDQLPAAGGVGLLLFASGPIVFMLELMGFTDLTTTF